MRFPAILFTVISILILLTLPTSNLLSYTCGPGGGEDVTEVAVPRAGIGVPLEDPNSELEFDTNNWHHVNPPTDCIWNSPYDYEYHSGFGWQFIDFDGTDANYSHIISVYKEENGDTVLVDPNFGTDTLSVDLNTEDFLRGWLCAFETFPGLGTYDRRVVLQSYLINNTTGDTLAQDAKSVTRRIFVVQNANSCP